MSLKKPTASQFDINAAAENAIRVIANASEAAAKTIAQAASEAAKVVATTAAESAKTVEFRRAEDHDLLITLREKQVAGFSDLNKQMEGLKGDIRELGSGNAAMLADHEMRLKKICEWRAEIAGPEGALAKITKHERQLKVLEDTNLTFQAKMKTWIIVGGLAISAIMFVIKYVLPALK